MTDSSTTGFSIRSVLRRSFVICINKPNNLGLPKNHGAVIGSIYTRGCRKMDYRT